MPQEPNVEQAIKQIDNLIAAMSSGLFKSSYEGQLLDMARCVRQSLVPPPPPVSVTITFSVDEEALTADYTTRYGYRVEGTSAKQMLTEILLDGYRQVTKKEIVITQARGEQQ